MGNKQDRSLIVLQHFLQGLDGGHVQEVCRLVQQEQIRRRAEQLCKGQFHPFPAAQAPRFFEHVLPADQKPRQYAPHGVFALDRRLHDVFQNRFVQVQGLQPLPEIPDLCLGDQSDARCAGPDQFHEGGFSCPVWPHQGGFASSWQREGGVFKDKVLPIAERNVFAHRDLPVGGWIRQRKIHLHRGRFLRLLLCFQLLQAGEDRFSGPLQLLRPLGCLPLVKAGL